MKQSTHAYPSISSASSSSAPKRSIPNSAATAGTTAIFQPVDIKPQYLGKTVAMFSTAINTNFNNGNEPKFGAPRKLLIPKSRRPAGAQNVTQQPVLARPSQPVSQNPKIGSQAISAGAPQNGQQASGKHSNQFDCASASTAHYAIKRRPNRVETNGGGGSYIAIYEEREQPSEWRRQPVVKAR